MIADSSSGIRRQVYELTVADLETFPSWEFALDEEDADDQDEATVRPYLKAPIDPTDGMLVVRATFTFADGTTAIGFLTPPAPTITSDIRDQQPTIVTTKGHVPLYFGMFPPSQNIIDDLLAALGRTSSEVFPLVYETDPDMISGVIKGSVQGFSFLKGGLSAGVIETV